MLLGSGTRDELAGGPISLSIAGLEFGCGRHRRRVDICEGQNKVSTSGWGWGLNVFGGSVLSASTKLFNPNQVCYNPRRG